MLITDPKVLEELKNIRPNKKPIEELKEDLTPCKHKIPFIDCLTCLYEKGQESTDHQIARAYYARFSEPLVIFNKELLTEENLKKYRKESIINHSRIIQKHAPGNFCMLLWYLRHTFEYFPDDDELNIIQYLFSNCYKSDLKISLSEKQKRDLEREQAHVYKCQINDLKRKIEIHK